MPLPTDPPTPLPTPELATVRYDVYGPARATSITYNVSEGFSSAQDNDVAMPWSKTVKMQREATALPVLIAQNAGEGSITCRITVDGTVVKSVTSKGPYAVVTCDGDTLGHF